MNIISFQPGNVKKEILYRDQNQAIVHLTLQAGEAIPEHRGNDAIGTVISIRGEITFSTEGQSATLVPGKLVRFDTHKPHSLKAAKDSEAIIVKWNNR